MTKWGVPLALVIALAGAVTAQERPPPYLDPVNRTVWRSDELRVGFSYPSVWKAAQATQPMTRIVINWRTQKSQALIATCYLEASAENESEIARMAPADIESKASGIALGYLKNMKQRAPDAKLIDWRAVRQDGYPAVYLEREGTFSTFDQKWRDRSYSIVTSWRNREINLECASTLTTDEVRSKATGDAGTMAAEVEKAIQAVLRTLQFQR